MTDLVISIAHGPNSTQAIEGLFNEYTISLMWSTLLDRSLKARGIDCEIINTPFFTDKKNLVNNFNPRLAIEIHFNEFHDESVRGSETLYHPGSWLGKMYAVIMQQHLGKMEKRNRGIKEGWYRGQVGTPLYFLAYTKPPALIIEPGFIDACEDLILQAPEGVALIADAIEEIFSCER